ncbi:unnamed protein product [Moneuplotes crassus]|uniref:SWIM-type domain-containing protein n=1 Tax=Euplotes crassus TaxID=5936 RepID=A0AAD2D3X7_EUPCR|nr:unnamed protein product [Moneuplotes crassus]
MIEYYLSSLPSDSTKLDVDKLYCVLEKLNTEVFEKALRMIEDTESQRGHGNKAVDLIVTKSGERKFYVVNDKALFDDEEDEVLMKYINKETIKQKEKKGIYYILADTCFCSCHYYTKFVLEKEAEMCHHIMAAKICEKLNIFQEKKVIEDYEFSDYYKCPNL